MRAKLTVEELAKLRTDVQGYGQEIADASGVTRQAVRSVLLGHYGNDTVLRSAKAIQKRLEKLKLSSRHKSVAA